MKQTHQTALTQYVEANGIRFAYRRFGKAGSVPLVFNMHFTGTRGHWDPAVTDGFAKDREIILFNNAGLQPSRRHCWRVVRSRPGSCGCCGHPGWSFATPIRRADECYCAHEEIRDEDRNRTSQLASANVGP